MKTKRCHRCNTPWETDKRRPGFKETCPQCDAYLHSCHNCRFFSPSAHNNCYIPNTEWVGDRNGANFCEEFEFLEAEDGPKKEDSQRRKARQDFDTLFGGGEDQPQAPTTLDDLFPG